MLPVTQASLVSQMREHPRTPRMSEDLRRYVRTEYKGNALPLLQDMARVVRERATRPTFGARVLQVLAKVPAVLRAPSTAPGGA